jgi:hypothetical protein
VAHVYDDAHDIVAHLAEVVAEVSRAAHAHATVATGLLAGHRHSGAARIEVDSDGLTDSIVWLSDTRGQRAALSIEFGRPRKGDMAALNILGEAFGINA